NILPRHNNCLIVGKFCGIRQRGTGKRVNDFLPYLPENRSRLSESMISGFKVLGRTSRVRMYQQ
ncbi:hypothetical protein, partial [Mesorhizobium sanjuanii]|uniref:hypothetical protein n=1 Tax=Mesorhizobium sanjuanii TaxID=2037900 RepID=UPI001AD84003